MPDDPRDFWEARYRSRDTVWSGRPNQALVDLASDLAPGNALDLGCGEGADAIWLARRGWQVTAVDVAPTALERAAAAAERADVAHRIEWRVADLGNALPAGSFDLVTAMFLHSPIELARDDVLRRAAAVVAFGGSLLVVGHATAPPWSRHHHDPDAFPSPQQTLDGLALVADDWDILVREVRERRDVEGPDGEIATLEDAVVMLRRRPSPGVP